MITQRAASAARPAGRSVASWLVGSEVARLAPKIQAADIVRSFPPCQLLEDPKGARCAFVIGFGGGSFPAADSTLSDKARSTSDWFVDRQSNTAKGSFRLAYASPSSPLVASR